MAKWIIEDTTLTDIADSIREQLGTTDAIAVTELASKILEIEGGSSPSGGDVDLYSVTPMSTVNGTNASPLIIDNPLGEVPTVFAMWTTQVSATNYSFAFGFYLGVYSSNNYYAYRQVNGNMSALSGANVEFTEDTIKICGQYNEIFVAGQEYNYIIF